MVKKEVFSLQPCGWKTRPENAPFKISSLDYLTGLCYTQLAVYIRLEHSSRQSAASVLKEGLGMNARAGRALMWHYREETEGHHSFVKKKQSTVRFIVQWLNGPEDANKFPSMNDMEKSSFSGLRLGDFKNWSIEPMGYVERPGGAPSLLSSCVYVLVQFRS